MLLRRLGGYPPISHKTVNNPPNVDYGCPHNLGFFFDLFEKFYF